MLIKTCFNTFIYNCVILDRNIMGHKDYIDAKKLCFKTGHIKKALQSQESHSNTFWAAQKTSIAG